jgi:4,5-dihydroxyphthalate decarboxylase
MASLTLSLGLTHICDRTEAIINGSIRPQGIEFIVSMDSPHELFRRQAQHAEFDVAEMSVSTYMALCSQRDDRLVGLPIFPRRAFRHGFIFVNTSSGITQPKELEGRRVGVSYQQTASLWIRGILRDEYGVETDEILWFEGGLNESGQAGPLPISLPERIKIERIGEHQTLGDMLRDGELDAVIGPGRPRCFVQGVPNVQRLIPNYRQTEQEYYRKTGFHPIMHMMVLRRSIYEAHPWTAQNIFAVFEEAKQWSESRLVAIAERICALPWLIDDIEELHRVFGKTDYWPYGIEPNRAILQKMIDMSYEDGLSLVRLEVDQLFAECLRQETAPQYA